MPTIITFPVRVNTVADLDDVVAHVVRQLGLPDGATWAAVVDDLRAELTNTIGEPSNGHAVTQIVGTARVRIVEADEGPKGATPAPRATPRQVDGLKLCIETLELIQQRGPGSEDTAAVVDATLRRAHKALEDE
jgi:hypothetical protein